MEKAVAKVIAANTQKNISIVDISYVLVEHFELPFQRHH
jgi:hypothetical protein